MSICSLGLMKCVKAYIVLQTQNQTLYYVNSRIITELAINTILYLNLIRNQLQLVPFIFVIFIHWTEIVSYVILSIYFKTTCMYIFM